MRVSKGEIEREGLHQSSAARDGWPIIPPGIESCLILLQVNEREFREIFERE